MKTTPFLLGAVVTAFVLVGCSPEVPHDPRDRDEGPHGGRWLEQGGLALEVTIFEQGVPPEFRVYASAHGEPVDPAEVQLEIDLERFGGEVDRFAFGPRQDHLLGSGVVGEPHSFNVTVRADYAGERYEWSYESHEGRTTIAPEMAARAGVEVATAGPGVLREQLTLYGTVDASPERRLHVTPRFPGVIESLGVNIGDTVRAGDTLAVVESNESLQLYDVKAPISGVVTERKANPGETAGSEPLFEITDFSSVVAELTVFPGDHARLARGQTVRVRASTSDVQGAGEITSLTPVHHTGIPTWRVRVTLQNEDGRWSPGLFVVAQVTIRETRVPLLVPLSALQSFRDWQVVFLNTGEGYQAQPLELGLRDSESAEVRSGLAPGDIYVVSNSYLIKADIEKSGASHDH
ncbi:MAG: efflux RND transporter periplasmic adaptor subunit [Deltaproteobacteria bacterium]|nr:efflux RND transporter periplasmic adaptor subunit [Deltaproteobacteria bacterium]MBW2415678.1 efflux RND transporter periplasmic adaptor subunit [Deltaproteobacteria bacterium]